MKMRFLLSLATMVAAALSGAGCDSGHGPDSLYNRASHKPGATISSCTQCHTSALSPSLDPLVTNGSGTQGKHIKHVQERGILCERCHSGYYTAPTHMNGAFDTNDPLVSVVSISIWGPLGTWTKTGPGNASCAGVACHGSSTLDWYGTNTWSPPACSACHVTAFSAVLDPVATNGTPPAGRHGRHVTSRGIACERCHFQYPSRLTHMNGTLDTPDPAVNVVLFNIVGTSGSWTGDAGAGTGQCANISCHGTDTLAWYGSSTWSLPPLCTTCHAASYSSALDPLLTNGSGLAGKHGKHVSSLHYACTKCHENYPSRASHASGVLDTQDPSVLLVWFDALNPAGTWVSDTGPETGACSSLFCHGSETPEWYGLGGVTVPSNCVICHSSALGSRRQVLGANGDFGANPNILSRHVNPGPGSDPTSSQCVVCHEMSQHMGGTVRLRNADTGSAVVYDAGDARTLEPFCLSCHDADGAGGNKAPFADGRTLGTVPNAAGDKISGYWNAAFTVHRNNGLTCAGSGAPATGCHGSGQAVNMHGSVNKGLLTRTLSLPPASQASYSYDQFKLCFDCHENYPDVTKEVILGYRQGGAFDLIWAPSPYATPTTSIRTLFRERYVYQSDPTQYPAYWNNVSPPYNDSIFADPAIPLHNYHLLSDYDGMNYVWDYRGSGETGRASCVTCHNVHGTSSPVRSVFEEFSLQRGTGLGPDLFVTLSGVNSLRSHPINCSIECHSIYGPTSYWYSPVVE